MSDRFITYVIIGVAFGFTQLWFAYWVVKLYKEKQRLLKARRAATSTTTAAATPAAAAATAATAVKPQVTLTEEPAVPPASPVVDHSSD